MTAETIEGTATVVREVQDEQRALAVLPERQAHLSSGVGAIAIMSDADFERNLELLSKGVDRAQRMQKALLVEGTDYGTVPGIPRPFLHKPGAEKFEKAYGLATSYEVERKVGDGVKTPELEYIVHAKVHLGDTDGPVVGEGLGSCNTHESKYRFRTARRSCPDCGREGLVKGKAESRLKGGYWCPPDKGGCNHSFMIGTAKFEEIEAQSVGQVENENPWDLANTILKMARKRAGVDGILTTTGTSGIFTQDEDSPSVQRDAGGSSSSSISDGAASRQSSRSAGSAGASGGRAQLPAMPKPGEITEPKEVGAVTVSGLITITDKNRTDGSLRQGKDGNVLGFQFDWAEGGKIATVILRRELAEALAELTQGDPAAINGVPATVTGTMWADPWKKKNDEGIAEWMPSARRLEANSIETEHWSLPKPGERSAAPAKESAKGKTPAKQTTVADAAHEATKAEGPGMTAAALDKALDAGRVAHSFAAAEAQDRFQAEGKTPDEILGGLTDQQRLALASQLGVLAEEE